MNPFVLVGAAAAALIAGVAILIKGGMVERPTRRRTVGGGGGSPSGEGIPDIPGEEEDPFKRYPRAREGRGGPEPTQTETQTLSNGDGWVSDDGGPAVSYASAGDGNGGYGGSLSPTPAALPGTSGGVVVSPFGPPPASEITQAPPTLQPWSPAPPLVGTAPLTSFQLSRLQ